MPQIGHIKSAEVNLVPNTVDIKPSGRGPGRSRGRNKKECLKGNVIETRITFTDGSTKIRYIGRSKVYKNKLGRPVKNIKYALPLLKGNEENFLESTRNHLDGQIGKRFSSWRPSKLV